MVNMVGFHHKEPVFNTAGIGEPGFFMRLHPLPTAEHPLRAKVTFPTGHAVFRDPAHALPWLDPDRHSEEIIAAAHYYRALTTRPGQPSDGGRP